MEKIIRARDVAGHGYTTGAFRITGGRAVYDEVYVADGGRAIYLVRVNRDLSITKRWIPWDQMLIQLEDLAD